MKAHIIYKNYLKPDGQGMSIGGIQTYIANLIPVLIQKGYTVAVHQIAERDFNATLENTEVFGYGYNGIYKYLAAYLYERARKNIDPMHDLVIFGSESLITENDSAQTIGIQHGIAWDKPERLGCSKLKFFADYVLQCRESWRTVKRIKNVDKLVCVDYNFVNWYRALVAHPEVETVVIPNFSAVADVKPEKDFSGRIEIVFSRRFFEYRGTRIFANAISRILAEYDNVGVTIAGDGPDREWLHNKLDAFDTVHFTQYQIEDSLAFHGDKHIALVPTLGSEGTSLSLLEAMASNCAIVCTNVGGMTNIVIDNYNGLMIQPEEEALYRAIKSLLDDRELAKRLADTAYEVVRSSFALEKWKEKWGIVIDGAAAALAAERSK